MHKLISHLCWLAFCIFCVFLPSSLHSQWSTSTLADSALYVCPGFYPGIATYKDGSSLIVGVLYSSIYAQRLDPYGYAQWQQPLLVHQNSKSGMTVYEDWGKVVSDGFGGAIMFWYDHRNSTPDDHGRPLNQALYMQRVDSMGNVLWQDGGVLIEGVETGRKDADIVGDGEEGCIVAWTTSGFDYPNAPGKQYLKAARFNKNAERMWEIAIDSSNVRADAFTLYQIVRGGEQIYLSYYGGSNYSRTIDIEGNIVTPLRQRSFWTISSEHDSVVYFSYYPNDTNIFKIGYLGDTTWISNIVLQDSCRELGGRYIQDDLGGMYYTNFCRDSIIHVNELGVGRKQFFDGIGFANQVFSDGNHGLVVANSRMAKRFDQLGRMIWNSAVLYLTDPNNAYFRKYVADYHGGIIMAFWTVQGGIHAQHTGRYGSVGVTGVHSDQFESPLSFSLDQNFPNPFNNSTIIRYSLTKHMPVELSIFDLLGRKVLTLVDGQEQFPGDHEVRLDASALPSGVYFYRLLTNRASQTRSFILAR